MRTRRDCRHLILIAAFYFAWQFAASANENWTEAHVPLPAFSLLDGREVDKVQQPCGPQEINRESDLCAQWRAADAATRSADFAAYTLWSSLVLGSLALVATAVAAFYAKRAAEQTKRAADSSAQTVEEAVKSTAAAALSADATVKALSEARAANIIAREALTLEQRPWLRLQVDLERLFFSFHGQINARAGMDCLYKLENIGKSPAKVLGIGCAGSFEFWYTHLRQKAADAAIDDFHKFRDPLIVIQGKTRSGRFRPHTIGNDRGRHHGGMIYAVFAVAYTMHGSDTIFWSSTALQITSESQFALSENGLSYRARVDADAEDMV